MKTRLIVSALIKNGDRYLFIRQQKPGGAYPNSLHLPGGGLDQGEDPESGVLREIEEEVGLKVTNLTKVDFDWDVLSYKGEPTLLIFLRFTADYAGGNATAGSDAAEILWLSRDEITNFSHNPPSIRLLRYLGLVT